MMDLDYEGTIDWDQYWQGSEDPIDDDANASTELVVDPLLEFIDETGVPDSHADVGCGGGGLAFAVADRYPETTVVGYDASKPVVKANRRRAASDEFPDVGFERAILPEFTPDAQFDLVTSFFTLCYVADIEAAIESLYDAVASGGYLVITYHNEYARSLFSDIAADPYEHLSEESAWDPDNFAERFDLVLEGESLLSYDRIHETLGRWPQSVWSAVDSERYGAWKQNPLVYVPK